MEIFGVRIEVIHISIGLTVVAMGILAALDRLIRPPRGPTGGLD